MPDAKPSPNPSPRRPSGAARCEILRLHDRSCAVIAWGAAFPLLGASTPRSDRASSRIYTPDEFHLVKVCLVQSSPKNQLLRAIGQSRAQIEADSNRTLDSLGLRAPRITAVASVINPFSLVDSALIVTKIDNPRDGLAYLCDETVPDSHRLEFVNRIVDGISRMLDARVVLRDFRLSNILVEGDDPAPIWIDNELKHTRSAAAAQKRLRITVARLIKKNCAKIPPHLVRALVDPLNRLISQP